jgi:predicted RNA binding protein YcfA (HicA-like mRNA interferase family)
MMSRGRAREFTKDERMQEVVAEALSDGWDAETTKGGHIRFVHPLVDSPVFAPSSPSDYRSAKNTRSQLNNALTQAQDQALSSREAAREADERMEEVGRRPLIPCQACRGQGNDKSFVSAEALVAHMGKVHPAPPLKQEPEPEPEPEPETPVQMPEEAPMPAHTHGPTLDEFMVFLEETHDPTMTPEEAAEAGFTIDHVLEHFELPNTVPNRKAISNRVQSLLKRTNPPIRTIGRGQYAYIPIDDAEELSAPPPAPAPQANNGQRPEPNADHHRLYEWVADTTDGRVIVKDDAGKVYFATFEEL